MKEPEEKFGFWCSGLFGRELGVADKLPTGRSFVYIFLLQNDNFCKFAYLDIIVRKSWVESVLSCEFRGYSK